MPCSLFFILISEFGVDSELGYKKLGVFKPLFTTTSSTKESAFIGLLFLAGKDRRRRDERKSIGRSGGGGPRAALLTNERKRVAGLPHGSMPTR